MANLRSGPGKDYPIKWIYIKKKWPLKVPESYLKRKICDLREEYGIQILSVDQRPKKFIKWSGAVKNPK